MRTKKQAKLALNKSTVTNLNALELNDVKGGSKRKTCWCTHIALPTCHDCLPSEVSVCQPSEVVVCIPDTAFCTLPVTCNEF